MSRKLKAGESTFLLVCILLLLGMIYYQAVWKSTEKAMETYNLETIEDELLIAQTKAMRMAQMERVIKEHNGETQGLIADYNNLENEITELNKILAEAQSYQLDFEDATTDGSIVRRNINIDFQVGDYSTAKNIIESLQNCLYKSLVRDVTLSAKEGGLQNTNQVNVSLQVTFYEGVTDEVSTAGLQKYKEKK